MYNSLFPHLQRSALIGMVHLLPLPGSPRWDGSMSGLIERALQDAENLRNGGCDAILVENMGDVPYLRCRIDDHTYAAMTIAVREIVALGIPTGIQVLAAANEQAMSMAYVTGAQFIRVEGFAYAHIADEGWIDACAGPLLRQRQNLDAKVKIWADIQKKHSSHAITADLNVEEWAKGAAFCGGDAVVVTGNATGSRTSLEEVKMAAKSGLPVVVGSGVTPDDIKQLSQVAQGLIVGSWLKEQGHWQNPVDVERVKQLRESLL